jgi:peptidase E
MTNTYIMATSGGFFPSERAFVSIAGKSFLRALELTRKSRPRVLFIHTASGDDRNYLTSSYQAVSSLSCDVEHLALFPQPTAAVEDVVGRADVVWVGGGSVANLLAVWQLHGVDTALREAWSRGVVVGGVSAGSLCWHSGGTTDSFGPELRPIFNGLALVPFANGVHYDSEPQRRPLLQSLVQSGELPTAYATDDRVGLLYVNGEAREVIPDKDVDPSTGPSAYLVEKVGTEVRETRLAHGVVA